MPKLFQSIDKGQISGTAALKLVTGHLRDVPFPVIAYRPDRRISFVNQAFLKLTGFKKNALIEKLPPYPFWKEQKIGRYKPGYFKADSQVREWEICTKDGRSVWIQAVNQPVQISGLEPGVISYIQDITQRRKALEDLQISEEKFLKVFNSIPLPMAITSLPERKFLDVNKAFLKTGGYSREDFIGKSSLDLDWQNQQDRELFDRKITKQRVVSDYEMRLISKDGKAHAALLSARTVKLKNAEFSISVSMDITKMREAEEALRESEAFNASLLHNAPNPVLVSNLDRSIRFVNPAFLKLTGFSKKELLGSKPPFPWWPIDKRGEYWIENKYRPVEEIDSLERQILKKNKELAWVSISTRNIKDNGQTKYYVAIWTDITLRKKAEEALNAELVRRRILIDQSSDGIVVLDQNGAVYEANLRFAEMLGYKPEEVRILHVWDWDMNRSRPELLETLRQTDEKGHHFESCHRRKDGTLYDVEVSTNGAYFAGQKLNFCVCRDISQRKQAEAALRESEHFNTTLLNDAPNPILVVNADGTLRYANPALEKLTGYASEEFLGMRPPPPWWPPDKIEEYFQQKLNNDGKDIAYFECPFRKKNGQEFWVSVSVRCIEERGQTKYYLANWVDITERKKMEEELHVSYQNEKKQREELEEEARLRGHFINVLAHELRTPITPILSSTDTLKHVYESKRDSIQKRLVENIYTSSNTLARRLEELLDMARHARGAFQLNIQPVPLKPFIEGVVIRFEPTLLKLKQELVVDLAPDLPEAEADASRLEQVFINLLSNASKFSTEGSSIYLTAKTANDEMQVEVRDAGMGISPEAQVRLFQPYYRVEQDRHQVPGLGLGLAVSRQIIEAHGGKIWVKSEKGRGSIFSFTIPLKKLSR